MNYYRIVTLFLLAGLMIFHSGCRSSGPAVQYVEGVVTLDGEPVEGANISFVPDPPGSEDLSGPLLASGRTNSRGKYTLTTTRATRIDGGTTVGTYRVTVVKKTMTNVPDGPVAPGQRIGPPRFQYIVPKVFEDSQNSPIKVEVVKGKNVFKFALKSDGTSEVTQ